MICDKIFNDNMREFFISIFKKLLLKLTNLLIIILIQNLRVLNLMALLLTSPDIFALTLYLSLPIYISLELYKQYIVTTSKPYVDLNNFLLQYKMAKNYYVKLVY
jgi:hypothetical protein